jgi:hypothetical protein
MAKAASSGASCSARGDSQILSMTPLLRGRRNRAMWLDSNPLRMRAVQYSSCQVVGCGGCKDKEVSKDEASRAEALRLQMHRKDMHTNEAYSCAKQTDRDELSITKWKEDRAGPAQAQKESMSINSLVLLRT